MRLALAPINPTVGDIEGNAALIAAWIDRARAAHANLIAFPELALTGYPPRDLLLQEGFVAATVAAAKRIGEEHTRGLTVVFGTPLPLKGAESAHLAEHHDHGLVNALLVYRDGRMLDYYDKRLLPTYDVFDEDRYFEPGERAVIINAAGARVGLTICEDLWRGEDVGFAHKYLDCADPVAALMEPPGAGRDGGAQLILNPSASPFVLGKGRRHRDILRGHAMRHGVWVAAVNQLGGNDDLIFDGSAAVIAPDGSVLAESEPFGGDLLVADVPIGEASENGGAASATGGNLVSGARAELCDEELAYSALVLGTRDYLRKTGFRKAVIGLSGGIDSAVTAVIAAAAIGPENLTGVAMPSRYSSEGSVTDARALAENLRLPFHVIPIEAPFAAFEGALAGPFAGREPDVTEENIQARCRGVILMAFANKFGSLLLTTGNKSELAVGYCTLYGDMNGGLAVLSDVDKGLVYRLAKWMNAHPERLGLEGASRAGSTARGSPIPESTITKPPSAELRPGQLDQDSLPPYDVLDEIIERYVEGRQSPARIVREGGFDAATVKKVVRLIDLSEYKRRQAATGLKLTGVAFGTGRRMPIAQGWRPERGV